MENSLSIVHVVYSLGVGGQERVILDLAAAQISQGHDVTVLVLSPAAEGDLEKEFAGRKVPVVRVPKGDGVRPDLVWRIRRFLARAGTKLVHTHNPQPLIYGAPAGWLARAGVVHTKHGEHRDTALRMTLRRQAARLVDAFVAVSEPTAAFARVHRECAAAKLQVIPNGTDLSRFARDAQARARIRDKLEIAETAFAAICVGRFVPEKNQRDLIRATSSLWSESFHLIFAGDGPLQNEVKAGAEGSPFVHFLGQRSDIPELLAAADAYVIPSVTEGLPIGLIEAMASCLPVIATAVGGIPAVLRDGELGILVPPGQPDALRTALTGMQANPESARRRAVSARKVALEEFGVSRMVGDYNRLYRDVLFARGKS
jgi:glycosyltransferase involved in cell wall biosynthesis